MKCGQKAAYTTKAEAEEVRKQLYAKDGQMHSAPYLCDVCGNYHLASRRNKKKLKNRHVTEEYEIDSEKINLAKIEKAKKRGQVLIKIR